MTTETAAAPTQTTATPAANSATPAPAASDTANAPAPAKDTTTNTAAPDDGSANKDSTGDDGAAPADKKPGDTDQSQDDGQSSDGKPSDDPDKKDQEDQGKDEETDVTQEYQQAAEKVELPEGMEMDKVALEAIAPVLKKYDVPPEAMQELMPVAAAMVSRAMKAQADKHEAQVTDWYDQTIATHGKEGPEAFEEKKLTANRAIKKFFSETDRNVLKEQGLGNLPGLFNMAYEIGLQMGEDGSTSAPGNGGSGDETLADVWYPTK